MEHGRWFWLKIAQLVDSIGTIIGTPVNQPDISRIIQKVRIAQENLQKFKRPAVLALDEGLRKPVVLWCYVALLLSSTAAHDWKAKCIWVWAMCVKNPAGKWMFIPKKNWGQSVLIISWNIIATTTSQRHLLSHQPPFDPSFRSCKKVPDTASGKSYWWNKKTNEVMGKMGESCGRLV